MEDYSTGKKSPPSFQSLSWKFFSLYTKKKEFFPSKYIHAVVLVGEKCVRKNYIFVSFLYGGTMRRKEFI